MAALAGDISLPHQGILLLDELPNFDKKSLEFLREPLESGELLITRAQRQVKYTAQFQLIAAMNPCPCGYFVDKRQLCECQREQVARLR